MLRKIARFLGYSLTEEQIEVSPRHNTMRAHDAVFQKLNEHMKFENFQKTSTNNKDTGNW
jgi:hypothetical protein